MDVVNTTSIYVTLFSHDLSDLFNRIQVYSNYYSPFFSYSSFKSLYLWFLKLAVSDWNSDLKKIFKKELENCGWKQTEITRHQRERNWTK
jgi:hypothetical protein